MAQRNDRAALGEGVPDGEIESLVWLHRRAVERARSRFELRAAALRALVCRLLRAVLHEQRLHAPIRGGLQRLGPTGRCPPAFAGRLPPGFDELPLLEGTGLLEERHGR